jgi:hypothetical protein
LHGLQPPETAGVFNEKSGYRELSEIAEQAKRRAEVARYGISLLIFVCITGREYCNVLLLDI